MSEYLLRLTNSGYLRVSRYLWERHLTPEADKAICQAIGTHLLITIPSDRETLQLRTPLAHWRAAAPYTRSINRESIHIERWRDDLQIVTDATMCGAEHVRFYADTITEQP